MRIRGKSTDRNADNVKLSNLLIDSISTKLAILNQMAQNNIVMEVDEKDIKELSKTERNIAHLVGNGLSNKEISEKLFEKGDYTSKYIKKAVYTSEELKVNQKNEKVYKTDIIVKVEKNIISIEMNKEASYGIFIKNSNYASKLRSEQLESGESYQEYKKVITINIDNFHTYKGNKIIYKFMMMELETKEIENDYYIFETTNKQNGKKEVILCGMDASKDFLKMLHHEGLPIFNPLRGNGRDEEENDEHRNGGSVNVVRWNPTARQLYNAIMWVIIILGAMPNTPIFDIKSKVYQNREYEPLNSCIKGVNTIIKRSFGGKTLTQVIDTLREGNDIRDGFCRFNLITNAIGEMRDKEGNLLELDSYF